jgi:hypothetical protein
MKNRIWFWFRREKHNLPAALFEQSPRMIVHHESMSGFYEYTIKKRGAGLASVAADNTVL